jgi:hypothetical protein
MNQFGVELLDCRAFSETMVSGTANPQVVETFSRLRTASGEQYCGTQPPEPMTWPCRLKYPHQGESRDGPLFKAGDMEEKWDIYLHDGSLYFARSWTGHLEFTAKIAIHDDHAEVTSVTGRKTLGAEDPGYPVDVVDYLIRSHLYGLPAPHPLPRSLGREPVELALFSFSQYGRRAILGTFARTSGLVPRQGHPDAD